MTDESRFNGEYQKTGSGTVTEVDQERVKKANEKIIKQTGE